MNNDVLNENLHQFGLRFRPVVLMLNILFGIYFLVAQIWPLVLCYSIFAFRISRLIIVGRQNPMASKQAIDIVWLVVLIQSLPSVLILGPEAGFHLHVLGTIPMIFANERWGALAKLKRILIIAIYFVICELLLIHVEPLYTMSLNSIHALDSVNILFTLTMLSLMSYYLNLTIAESQRQLVKLANTDPLTGLLNRRSLSELADKETSRAHRSKSNLAIVICDIDYFKKLNDNYGHDFGDQVLKCVSQTMKDIRSYEYQCRWGGEEFVLVLPEASQQQAAQLAERLRIKIQSLQIPYEDQPVPVTMTFGVAQMQQDEDWHATLARADAALYEGKESGRNRVIQAE
ncbi:MAG: GGDEF domain-containing protein [Pseudomonadota bacterium]|nr:GGDEF domain-containing protein [Pseudomonadota bacterium]